MVQLQTENDLLQKRAESAEAELERDRGLHRRELRRRAKELTDIQKDLSQVRRCTVHAQLRAMQCSVICC